MGKKMIKGKDIKIFDNTLRDGEQQACINFSKYQKDELAVLLKQLGFDYIDLMPCQNSVEEEIALDLINKGIPLSLSTPLKDMYIEQSMGIANNLSVFQAVSDELLSIRYKTNDIEKARKQNIDNFVYYLKLIREKSPDANIFAIGEDTTNADREYLLEFVNAITPFADAFIICDSKGIAKPKEFGKLTKFLFDNANIQLGIHTHNDLGYAEDNAIEAIRNGARILTGTINGIGERAGNCDIRKVLSVLREEDNIILPNIKYDLFDKVEKVVREYAVIDRASPNTPQAFWHETGIHVNALLSDPAKGYNAVDPNELGFSHNIFFGKKSGISNFKWYLGSSVSEDILKEYVYSIKEKSIQENRSFTWQETQKILDINIPCSGSSTSGKHFPVV